MVLSAAFLKIIVDTFVLKSFVMSVIFLSKGHKETKNFMSWKIFVSLTILLTIIESITVATTRIVYTPELFGDTSKLNDGIVYLLIALEYFIIPIGSLFRSICAIIYSAEQCWL
jgi:hypothetical protein